MLTRGALRKWESHPIFKWLTKFGSCGVVFFFCFRPSACAKVNGTIPLYIRGRKIVAEIARTAAQREKGLMFRRYLPPNHGMLFIFNHDRIRYFWMKNTLIPLDIAFMDHRGIIRAIKSMRPLDTTLINSGKPARFALEVNFGYFKKFHIRPGEKATGIPAARDLPARRSVPVTPKSKKHV